MFCKLQVLYQEQSEALRQCLQHFLPGRPCILSSAASMPGLSNSVCDLLPRYTQYTEAPKYDPQQLRKVFFLFVTASVRYRLPRAATCFNTLYLPQYSSQSVMQHRLEQACSAQLVFDEGESWAASSLLWALLLLVGHDVDTGTRLQQQHRTAYSMSGQPLVSSTWAACLTCGMECQVMRHVIKCESRMLESDSGFCCCIACSSATGESSLHVVALLHVVQSRF